MGILDRPYIGTFAPNKRKAVQWTPDALVYLNGDTAMAGCRTCKTRIDIQKFVTSVSVDAGTEPGAASSSISLSIPRHYGDSILRDGNTILRNGLEVHVYMRGYFPMTGMADDTDTVSGVKLGDIPQYPYYPVFHGVITGVSHEYSGGYYTASLTCAGMLHFWSYMQISTNGAAFGARPENSGVRPNMKGHKYTGMTPYGIIYSLYRDTAGAAAGVGFALQSRSNYRAVSSVTGDSSYSLMVRYWERRFLNGMYRLRMHGASGSLFSGAQQAYLARLNSGQGQLLSTVGGNNRRGTRDPLISGARATGLVGVEGNRVNRQADLSYTPPGQYQVVVPQLQAYVNDISQYANVQLFESTYESKLDVATQVTTVSGYEFYQDMDGDLVFKPPLYNLDTSSSRVYRIETEDIISISFTEAEPEATYCIVKGGPFQNQKGVVDAAEFGVRSTYIDYRLVAQFGWRESSVESNYFSNAKAAYYAAITQLDRVNKGVNACSITIPLRPELRPGYPVFIPHIDCFYYVESLSHSLSFGSSATTTLNLVARRRKFFPPGAQNQDVTGVDLSRTTDAPRSLQYVDNGGFPRLLGFPNVVMALDPEKINPLFFVVGFLAEEAALRDNPRRPDGRDIDAVREQFLANFVQILHTQNLLGIPDEREIAEHNATLTASELRRTQRPAASRPRRGRSAPAVAEPVAPLGDEETRVLGGPWTVQVDEERGLWLTYEDLKNALQSLLRVRSKARELIAGLDNDITDPRTGLDTQLRAAENRLGRADSPQVSDTQSTAVGNLNEQIRRKRWDITTWQEFLQLSTTHTTEWYNIVLDAVKSSIETAGVSLAQAKTNLITLMFLIANLHRSDDPASTNRDMDVDSTGAINNTSLILELLSDRKAAIGLNTPGYYRYYSASHPEPKHQGYADFSPTAPTPPDSVIGVNPLSETDATTHGIPENRRRDFVSLQDRKPSKGMHVRTFSGTTPSATSTSEITALSFEQRESKRFGSELSVVVTQQTAGQLHTLASAPGGGSLGTSLGNVLNKKMQGNSLLTGGAVGTLVQAAVASTEALVGPDNKPLVNGDYTGGVPNNLAYFNGQFLAATVNLQVAAGSAANAAETAKTILNNKAKNLVQQLNQVYAGNLIRASALLSAPGGTITNSAGVLVPANEQAFKNQILMWLAQLRKLFKSANFGGGNGFRLVWKRGVISNVINQFSPVFPVSDAHGYEHFGTYPYGRGLSIEEGGNYQRLMSLDPFQYVDPSLADEYVRALRRDHGNLEGSSVAIILAQVVEDLQSPNAPPGAETLVLRFRENVNSMDTTLSTTNMIANGLRNFLSSNLDAVNKLPVSNVAYALSDLAPLDQTKTCECRGSEADLVLGAYMAGVNSESFVSIEGNPQDTASAWTSAQMVLASDSWTLAQAAMRGSVDGRSRSSIFDTANGALGLFNQVSSQIDSLGSNLGDATTTGVDRLNQLASNVRTSANKLGG